MGPNVSGSAESSRTLQSLETTFEVLEFLRRNDGARVAEITEALDLSKSGVYNHITTLLHNEWIVREGDVYTLSLKFLIYGQYVRNQNLLYRIAQPEIKKLAEKTGETAHLATSQHGNQINLLKELGEFAVGDEYHTRKLQQTSYHHDTATGKAILAFLDRSEVERILDQHGLPSKTENTITDRQTLFENLEQIRERGYSFNDEEEVEGLRAVGAPIRTRTGEVLGSLSVSGPTSRLKGDRFREELPEEVTSTANVIEVNLNMYERISAPDEL